MSNLQLVTNREIKTIDSRDVAAMVGKQHSHLLRDIDGYVKDLQNPKLDSNEFFIPNTYHAAGGKRPYPNYLVTRKGCDMIANKLTGTKGVQFTAAYVNKFHEMEAAENRPVFKLPTNYVEALRELADILLPLNGQGPFPVASKNAYPSFSPAESSCRRQRVCRSFAGVCQDIHLRRALCCCNGFC